MSPWWRRRLLVRLAPDRVAVSLMTRGPLRRAVASDDKPVTATTQLADWRASVKALASMAGSSAWRGADLTVMLSPHFTHCLLLPWVPQLLRTDALAYAGSLFESRLGADLARWTIRVAPGSARAPGSAVAVESELIAALKNFARTGGTRLYSLRPMLTEVLDRLSGHVKAASGRLAMVEPGHVTVSHLVRGQCMSIRSGRCGLDIERGTMALLEQDLVCAGEENQPMTLFLQSRVAFDDKSLRDRGWRIVRAPFGGMA